MYEIKPPNESTRTERERKKINPQHDHIGYKLLELIRINLIDCTYDVHTSHMPTGGKNERNTYV